MVSPRFRDPRACERATRSFGLRPMQGPAIGRSFCGLCAVVRRVGSARSLATRSSQRPSTDSPSSGGLFTLVDIAHAVGISLERVQRPSTGSALQDAMLAAFSPGCEVHEQDPCGSTVWINREVPTSRMRPTASEACSASRGPEIRKSGRSVLHMRWIKYTRPLSHCPEEAVPSRLMARISESSTTSDGRPPLTAVRSRPHGGCRRHLRHGLLAVDERFQTREVESSLR
jgi:hypothetical protein